MEASHITAKSEESLRKAQIALEEAIELYAQAGQAEAKYEMEYRQAKSEAIKRLGGEGTAVGVRLDLAQGETAPLKEKMVQAEVDKNRCRFLIEAYKERMYNIRFLGRIGDDVARAGN